MRRRWIEGPLAAAVLAAALAACSDTEGRDGGETDPAETVPSVEELERRAEQEITPENADAELERLKNEIQSDG